MKNSRQVIFYPLPGCMMTVRLACFKIKFSMHRMETQGDFHLAAIRIFPILPKIPFLQIPNDCYHFDFTMNGY